MSKIIKIEIPDLPPAECSPNWRGHWSQKSVAARNFRYSAKLEALQSTGSRRPELEKAELRITFFVRDSRFIRDTDNALAALKPAVDGCVDAGIVKDDSPDRLAWISPVAWEIDKQRAPMTVLEFREVK